MGRPSIGAIHAQAISRLSVVERYLIKAQTLGVPIMTESEFINKIK